MTRLIHTDRLLLRPVSHADLALFVALLSDAVSTRYLPSGEPYSIERIEKYVANRIAHWQRGFGTYTIFLNDTPIGYAGVEVIADSPDCVDIRYAVLPSVAGKGYAFEAAKAVLKETFATTSLTQIYGVAVAENVASVRILQKLGMQADPTLQLYDNVDLLTFRINNTTLTESA